VAAPRQNIFLFFFNCEADKKALKILRGERFFRKISGGDVVFVSPLSLFQGKERGLGVRMGWIVTIFPQPKKEVL
jgi:hypothetical protein